jgi:HEAT repeat protein
MQAVDLLTLRRDEAMVGVLQNLVQKEDNSYVRSKCTKALKEMNASVGTF